MNEKILRCGIKKDKGYLYFIDMQGDISRCRMKRYEKKKMDGIGMIIGRRYRKYDGRKCFSFGIKSGIYKGILPNGFHEFDLGKGKTSCHNGGEYQLLRKGR